MIRDFPTPDGLGERAASWLDGAVEPAPTRAAATVVLVRDAAAGTEVFLMRRQRSMAFAGGMVVFPGGGVDARDGDDPDLPWRGPDPAAWAARLGVPEPLALEIVCAAVRETFEECGVLLATPETSDAAAQAFPTVDDPGWERDRQRLLAREVALSDLLVERGLALRSDLLVPWAHWTTPEFEPRRYDTWFLLAQLPEGRTARHLGGGEASESGWYAPQDVLGAVERGEVAVLPPTLVALEELAAAPGCAALLGADRVLDEVLPVVVREPDGVVLRAVLPEQPS